MKIQMGLIITICVMSLTILIFQNCSDDTAFKAYQSINIRNNLGILINNNDEYTTDLDVQLTLTTTNLKANEMLISFDPNCSQGFWETLQANKPIELNSANQLNVVYVKYRSPEQEEGPCISDSIIHDNIAPTVKFENQPGSWVKETSLRIGIDVEDLGSGVQSIECDKQGSGHFEICGSNEMVYDSMEENQNYVLVVRARDKAGNPSEPRQIHWALDRTPPTLTLSTGPSSVTADTTPGFSFIPIDRGSGIARLECRLDSQTQFSPCQFQFSLSGLSDGSHSLEVRAVDGVGWVSQLVSHSWIQDATAPTIYLTEKPPSITGEQRAAFQFSGGNNNQGIVSYKCQIDSGVREVCSSPHTLSGLSRGQHSFSVFGLDSTNNESQPSTYVWLIDTSKPSLTLLETPDAVTRVSQAQFAFQAQSQGSGIREIQCKIDGGTYGSCESPIVFNNLSEGTHTLMVQSVSEAGNFSDVASYQWTIDQTDPTVSITSHPEDLTNSKDTSFSFTAQDIGSEIKRIECRLDSGSFETCQESKSYTGLSEGGHDFSVRAWDQAHNPSPVETYSWFISISPPTVTLNISTNQPLAPVMNWKVRGGNHSLPYTIFNNVNSRVPTNKPENWFVKANPFLSSHIRIGNFIFGDYCKPEWVNANQLILENLVSSFNPNNQSNPLQFNFQKIDIYIRNMLASGVKPHFFLTGTPKAIAGSNWECGNFGNIATPPPPENMDYLEKTYDGLISHLKAEFGNSNVQSWRWSTWNEFNCPCSFKGSVDDAIEIVRRSVSVAKTHGLSLELGNFVNPMSNEHYGDFFLEFIRKMKEDPDLDIWNDTPSIGISLYGSRNNLHPDEVVDGLREMRRILTEEGYEHLPISIDEFGILTLPVNGQPENSYLSEMGIYGTSWMAYFFHEIMFNNSEIGNLKGIYLWQYNHKFPGPLETFTWVIRNLPGCLGKELKTLFL